MKYSHCNLLRMCREKCHHISAVKSLPTFTRIESFVLRLWNGHDFGRI